MPDYRIVMEDGAPRLYVNGVKTLPYMYQLSDIPGSNSNTAQAQKNIRNFADIGVNLVGVDTGLYLGWHRVTPFDPEALLEEIAAAVDANPNAKVLVRLHVNAPYWWHRDNPDECTVYRKEDGDFPGIDNGESDRLIRDDGNFHLRASFASEKWLADAGEVLAKFCEALKASPIYESTLALQIACGKNGEWHQWGTDVSKPMISHFRRYLREKYVTDEALAEAWRQPGVTIGTAEFHPEPFREGDDGWFRDPRRSQFVSDAQHCNQTAVADAILHFCRIVKEKTPELLAGTFYGYYQGTGGSGMTIGGHLEVGRMFRSPYVDFLCGPFCYMENRKPWGVPIQRALLESCRLNGKLWLTEMDQSPSGTAVMKGGDPAMFDETVYMLRRNVLQPLLAGEGLWFYDHRIVRHQMPEGMTTSPAASIWRKFGWWDTPELMREISALRGTAERYTMKPYRPAADVLMVYDTHSFYQRARVNDRDYSIHEAVMRCSAASDDIYADDLPLAELDRYRCVIFSNCTTLTPERRAEFRRLLAGKTVVWLWAQGYCDGKTIGAENTSETVGMKIVRTSGHTSCETVPPLPALSLTLKEDSWEPQLACADGEAEVLARYENGEAAAAVKGSDIWLGVPSLVCPELLAPIFEKAGVHRYVTSCGTETAVSDPVLAGNGLLAVVSYEGGLREITFPNGLKLTQLLPPRTTAVYDTDTGERVL